MEPRDEFVHEYPRPLDAPWKENWYFNFIDRKNRAWGINHISLTRLDGKGRFTAFHVVDEQVLMYSNLIVVEDHPKELTDGRLKFEFLEPERRFRVTFNGPQHKVELNYQARFPVFDYATGGSGKPRKKGAMSINHYEQALFVKGTLEMEGKSRPVECLGHRDHSWGYRDESKVTGWNWIAVQMRDMTINMSKVIVGEAFLGSGFVSRAEGNVRIVSVSIEETKFDNGVPRSSVFVGEDEQGKTWRLKSEKFSGLYLPMREKGDSVAVHENFAEYTNLDTGEQGVGIDEYLVNTGIKKSEEA